MSSKLDESDFVDRDLEATKEAGTPSHGVDDSTATAPPSREELTSRVTETQQKLAELKRIQEEVERESNELQEARKRRIELKVSQTELANFTGLHRKAIAKIEAGNSDLRLSTLLKVTALLGMRVDIEED